MGGCSRSDPERELRAAVAAMAQAIEQREPAAFLNFVSDEFARESGGFGKSDVKRVLAGAYLRNQKLMSPRPSPTCASKAGAPGQRYGSLQPAVLDCYRSAGKHGISILTWRREDGRWKVYNAEWVEGL